MKPVVLLLSLVFTANAFSQNNDTLLRKYNRQFITRFGSNFMMDNQKLSFRELQPEFDHSSLGMEFYQRAKKQRNLGNVFRFVALGAMFGTISGISNRNNSTAFIFLGVQFVSTIISGSFRLRSVTETDRALQIRNRELLFPGR
jgi:hypothetical protein